MLQNLEWVKELFKGQVRLRVFNVTKILIDMDLDSTKQPVFKKLPLLSFGVIPKKKIQKPIKTLLHFLLYICVKLDFLQYTLTKPTC